MISNSLSALEAKIVNQESKIPVGISACLLGQEVRYNGGHKQSRFCVDHLSKVFDFQSFCPEVAIGLGVPRETIRLVDIDGDVRVRGTQTESLDVTDALKQYGTDIGIYSKSLCGYVLMKNSPSCGLFSAKVYRNEHPLPGKHSGMFVRALKQQNPLLPLEEEGRLNDPRLRENFIARVFAYHDWKTNVASEPSARRLVEFHSRYKYLVMAHHYESYRRLGQRVASAGTEDINALCDRYIEDFMTVIQQVASRKGHANTLYHLLGYLREEVPGTVRQDLAKTIEDYRKEVVNLAVPVTMLSHYLKLYGSDYVKSQAYLEPHAHDLGLRNTI